MIRRLPASGRVALGGRGAAVAGRGDLAPLRGAGRGDPAGGSAAARRRPRTPSGPTTWDGTSPPRVAVATPISLAIGLVAAAVSLFVGFGIGGAAGYFGGVTDLRPFAPDRGRALFSGPLSPAGARGVPAAISRHRRARDRTDDVAFRRALRAGRDPQGEEPRLRPRREGRGGAADAGSSSATSSRTPSPRCWCPPPSASRGRFSPRPRCRSWGSDSRLRPRRGAASCRRRRPTSKRPGGSRSFRGSRSSRRCLPIICWPKASDARRPKQGESDAGTRGPLPRLLRSAHQRAPRRALPRAAAGGPRHRRDPGERLEEAALLGRGAHGDDPGDRRGGRGRRRSARSRDCSSTSRRRPGQRFSCADCARSPTTSTSSRWPS